MIAEFGALAAGLSRGSATVVLSLISAAVWGTSDFLGGVAARRLHSAGVVLISHAFSLCMLVSLALAIHSPLPDRTSAIYGLIAGLTCGTGVIVLYRALALGGMGLTAAISGVTAAALPAIWAFATEGLPSRTQLSGIVLAAVAIWLIARSPGAAASRPAMVMGAVAGASFGALFILLKLAGRGGVLWPLACSRLVSASLAALLFLRWRARTDAGTEPAASFRWWPLIGLLALTGFLDAGGNSLYTLATRLGRLDIAAVLGSLYPAGTIVLAALILKERTTRTQAFGIALAMGAVLLISS